MCNNLTKFRIFLWLSLVFVVSIFLYLGIVPFGKIKYHLRIGENNSFISNYSPIERLDGDGKRVIGDPVYFTLHTPRTFDKAKVIYRYKVARNDIVDSDVLNIESGVLVDKIIWRYNLIPVKNTLIDQLSKEWDVISENNILLLQRNKNYDLISEFLDNLPNIDKIAIYNYKLKTDYLLDDYQNLESEYKLEYDLRGPYQFYTYIKDEDLSFLFEFQDLNQNKDIDKIDLHLYYDDKLIISKSLDDDGLTEDTGKLSEIRDLKLNVPNLPEGVYKIELRCGDDIVTRRIITEQKKLSFIANVRLMKSGNENLTMYTDSNLLHFKTVNPDSLQNIVINNNPINVSETYRQFDYIVQNGTTSVAKLEFEEDGVIIAGNGVFSFNEQAIINPSLKKVDNNLRIENTDYIIADYIIPKVEKGWNISEIEIDLKSAYREENKYNFIISIPGLKIDDGKGVEFSDVWIELEGRTIFDKLFN